MLCFGSSRAKRGKKRYHQLKEASHVSVVFPTLASQYLPTLSEVQVQSESEEIIDDPSMIFYDPDERPGFVYKAIPFISKGYDFSYIQPTLDDDESLSFVVKEPSKKDKVNILDDVGSSEFDDSLDGTSFPNTPTPAEQREGEIFNKEFDVSSRRDSLEFDNILGGDQLTNIDNFIPGMESTRNMELHESIHQTSYQENSFADAYEGMNLVYDDNLLNLHTTNKGYVSDAESVKTYQDSGIYDDDIDSPKADGYSRVARQLVFGTQSDGFDAEKFSAFKTPMSSKQSSIESLIPVDDEIEKVEKPVSKRETKLKADFLSMARRNKGALIAYYCSEEFLELYLGEFRINEPPRFIPVINRLNLNYLQNDDSGLLESNVPSLITPNSPEKTYLTNITRPISLFHYTPHTDSIKYTSPQHDGQCTPTSGNDNNQNGRQDAVLKTPPCSQAQWEWGGTDTSFDQTKPMKSANKYSYVQAKVQCHRTKGERSPSPGNRLRSQSAGSNSRHTSESKNNNKTKTNDTRLRSKSPSVERHITENNTAFAKKPLSSKKGKTKASKEYNPKNKVFNEKLTFRERAKSRTDTHGVEMYSNLPKEFQEIARRLARQDRELKKSETDIRGRSLSRRSSRVSSRTSSLSPTYARKSHQSNGNDDNNLANEYFGQDKDINRASKQLSRSSSIRSIPSTPAISRQHPLPSLQHAKSPTVSPGRSPAHRSASSDSNRNKRGKDSKKKKEKRTKSWTPTSVNKLYTFTTMNESFGTSPSGNNSMFHVVPVR